MEWFVEEVAKSELEDLEEKGESPEEQVRKVL